MKNERKTITLKKIFIYKKIFVAKETHFNKNVIFFSVMYIFT